jgi:hypothetical protein
MKLGSFETVTDASGYFIPLVNPNVGNAKIDPENLTTSSAITELTGTVAEAQVIFDTAIGEGKNLFYLHGVTGYGGGANAGIVMDSANGSNVTIITLPNEINYLRFESGVNAQLYLTLIGGAWRVYNDGATTSFGVTISGSNVESFDIRNTGATDIIFNFKGCNVGNIFGNSSATGLTAISTEESNVGAVDLRTANTYLASNGSNYNYINVTGAFVGGSNLSNSNIGYCQAFTVNSVDYSGDTLSAVSWDLTTNPTNASRINKTSI